MTSGAVTKEAGSVEPNPQELCDAVGSVLQWAKEQGADQAEAAASHDVGLSVTARLGDVESLEYTNDRGIGVTVYINSCKGSASTSDFSEGAVREAVAKACSIAALTQPDEFAGLADAERMAEPPIADLDLYHPWSVEADAAIEIAIECEGVARAHDERITNSEGATVSTNVGVRAYGNSHGFLNAVRKTSHSLSCTVVGEADGEMQRDYWYSTARQHGALEGPKEVGRKAAKRTVERLGARKIATTTAPVVFSPEIARGFIGHAVSAIAGGAQYRRSSFLLDAVGEQIFPSYFRLEERPHLKGAMASAAYDAEGVATYDRDIVADGVLQEYVLSSYSARRLGLSTTANAGGAQNLIVPGNVADLQEILGGLSRGLLVTELIGQGVNGVTGDYSRGAAGFWIERGEAVFPVHEVTIAGNLRDLYQRIEAVGNDQDVRGGIRCGSLLVGEMTIAGD